MRTRTFIFPLLAAGIALLLWWCSPRATGPAGTIAPKSRDVAVSTPAMPPAPPSSSEPAAAAEFPLAALLNAPGSTIAADLDALSQILDAWRSNFPREGNPVGDNHEIAAALLGDNPMHFALIPKDHPALNARGELCDRWGTPFRFHALSGEHMEISSAGPDQKFGTADDARWSPGS